MASPPRLPLRFFRWFCHPDLHPGIEGDLFELFEEHVEHFGARKARWKFTWDVVKLLRPSIIRPTGGTYQMNYFGQWKHHFKMARRQLLRNKAHSAISIVGLGVGIAAFYIILQYISFELSFDHFHTNKEEIYRVVCQSEDQVVTAANYKDLSDHIESNFPEVKNVTQFRRSWNMDGLAVKIGEQIFYERDVIHTSTSFFKVFPSFLKYGNPLDSMQSRHSVVIAEHLAYKYFGNTDPIGQIVDFGHLGKYPVSGISLDIPDNAHFKANIFILESSNTFNGWRIGSGSSYYVYITLNEYEPIPVFEDKLTRSVRGLKDEFPHLANDEFKLQPLTNIHLQSNLTRELGANMQADVIYFLAAIGLLILFIAWFNHINLSTSMFFTRIREIGIRKAIGSGKFSLTIQLLSEYNLVILLAIILSAGLVTVISLLLAEGEVIPDLYHVYNPQILWGGVSIFVLGSILVGLYPGLLISRLSSTPTLKTKFTSTKLGIRLRSILMIIQFVASLGLIIGVSILTDQLNHLRSSVRKMNVNNVITVNNPTGIIDFNIRPPDKLKNYLNFKNRMVAHSAIEHLTASSDIPGSPINLTYPNQLKRKRTDPDDAMPFSIMYIDDDFFNVYKVPLLAGRGFSSYNQQDLDHKTLILSKSAIDHLGFESAADAIGKEVSFLLEGWRWVPYHIVGVFDDYQHESTKSKAYPLVMQINRGADFIHVNQYYSFRIGNEEETKMALDHLIKTWEDIWPEKSLEFYFVDQVYEKQFIQERMLSRGFVFFAIIAVVIASLGLLGTTVYEIRLRTKEISIHKVMGSSIAGIFKLFLRKYFGLLALSILITFPFCIWLGHSWLKNYPDRIELTPSLFIPAIGIMLCVVLISSGLVVYRAANTNPVENLRDE